MKFGKRNMRDKNALFLVHRIHKDNIVKKGGADYIADYLKTQGYWIIAIEHPLYGSQKSFIKCGEDVRKFQIYGNGPIRWVQEIFFNIHNTPNSEKKDFGLILAVDPLNFVSAYLIKLFKQKKTKILFHSIDYSENRFEFFLLDYVYNLLYAFSVRNADIVTFVSKVMGEKIKEIRGKNPNSRGILHYLPNSPEYEKIPKVNPSKKNENAIVYSKSFISNSEIKILSRVIKEVVVKHPNVVLHIVGNVKKNDHSIDSKSEMRKNIKFYGLVPYEKNIEIMSHSSIGLGWYENKLSFEKYNDSLKLREYAASGLPAICNNKTSTALEMENEGAGIVANTEAEIAIAISALISDNKKYLNMRQNRRFELD